MKDEFGIDRLKVIYPQAVVVHFPIITSVTKTAYAKTGTLSLSGFFYTSNNKLLIFSVLINNHHGSATAIRRTVEKFLQTVCN
jgi:serine-type D-Ala-D-Ala carboxypeptidase/endopeptidase (penicillin-binding protein 4)